jgi:hypothetical protein
MESDGVRSHAFTTQGVITVQAGADAAQQGRFDLGQVPAGQRVAEIHQDRGEGKTVVEPAVQGRQQGQQG